MVTSAKIKVVCMGDSITEGFGVDPKDSYPAKLQAYLGEGCEVFNQGVCCSTVNNIVMEGRTLGLPYMRQERYQEGLDRKGDIYVILLGTNDAQDGMGDTEDVVDPYMNMIAHKEKFAAHYQKIIDGIHKVAPGARIFMGLPAPVMNCIWRRHQEKYIQELMPYFYQIMEANPEVRVIDVHRAFMELKEEERKKFYQEDGLHPNAAGLEVIAATVWKALRELL